MAGGAGLSVEASTISDWVHAFTPRCIDAARRHRHSLGRKWRVDETLFKIGGCWRYAFRAIDEDGQIVDVVLSDHRDAASARSCFEQAMTSTCQRHALIRNLGQGFSDLTSGVPPRLRLATAWTLLMAAL